MHIDSPYPQCILFLLSPGTLQDTDPRPTLKLTFSLLPYPENNLKVLILLIYQIFYIISSHNINTQFEAIIWRNRGTGCPDFFTRLKHGYSDTASDLS